MSRYRNSPSPSHEYQDETVAGDFGATGFRPLKRTTDVVLPTLSGYHQDTRMLQGCHTIALLALVDFIRLESAFDSKQLRLVTSHAQCRRRLKP